MLWFFTTDQNYDHHCIIKKLAKKFEEEFNCLEENTKKKKKISGKKRKKMLKGLVKMEKSQKPYLLNYNLLIVKDL